MAKPGAAHRALIRFSTAMNPVVEAILRSPFHWLLSPGLMLITVTGRKSGRRFTIPVGYHEVDGRVIVVLIADAASKVWWRNYRAPGPIDLLLRRETVRAEAEVIPPDSDEYRRRAEGNFARSSMIARIFGIRYDRGRGLGDSQLVQLREYAQIVRITRPA